MQRYSVKYRTVRSAIHGTIHPYGLLVFGFATMCVCACMYRQVKSLPHELMYNHCCDGGRVQSAAHTQKLNKENGDMARASTSEGSERPMFEEAPASFKSLVWVYFGFAIEYNDEGAKTVDRNFTVCKRCLKRAPYTNENASNMTRHLQRKHPDITLPEHRTVQKVTPA